MWQHKTEWRKPQSNISLRTCCGTMEVLETKFHWMMRSLVFCSVVTKVHWRRALSPFVTFSNFWGTVTVIKCPQPKKGLINICLYFYSVWMLFFNIRLLKYHYYYLFHNTWTCNSPIMPSSSTIFSVEYILKEMLVRISVSFNKPGIAHTTSKSLTFSSSYLSTKL